MKRMAKRIISLMLAAVMVFGAAPLAGFVGLELPSLAEIFTTKAEASTSGKCGNNLTWTFDESTGELVISGTGDMSNYSVSAQNGTLITITPWNKYYLSIKSVTIGDGVTSIGKHAFNCCYSLTSVTISDSVKSIGDCAFGGCDSLENVYYTGDVAGWCAIDFFDSSSNPIDYAENLYINGVLIKKLVIPDSVTNIGDYAFCGYLGLTSIIIPDSVTSIGGSAFYSTAIYNDSSNWENGVLYIGNHLIKVENTIDGSYVIKDGTKVIADSAFSSCDSLTSVTIPDSVTSIGNQAFSSCDSLTSITIPDSVTSIGDYAFHWCDSLTSVTIGNGVTSIGGYAFYSCNSLTSVTIGNGVTSIGDYAFYSCDSLTSITIPDSVTSIGNQAFDGCNSLTNITIGDGVTSIGNKAFYSCNSLEDVYYTGDIAGWCAIDFFNSSSNPIDYAENLYINGVLIKELVIPDSVTNIGDYAFFDCGSLTSVTIGNSVTSIGDYAFYACHNITETRYIGTPEQWKEISIGSDNSELTENVIYECDSERPYYGAGYCGENLMWKLYTDGELVISGTGYMTDWSSYSSVPWDSCRSKIKSVTIGNGIKSIGDYAFYRCGLTRVTIGNSVTSIGDYAFYYCIKLVSVTIPGSVTSIGDYAFYSCDSLTSVTIPDSVTSIGDYAFHWCDSLTSVTIGNSVTSIGSYAFRDCDSLTSITIPDSVTSIGSHAFLNCGSLTSVTIGNGVTSIGNQAFDVCNSLEDVYYTGDIAGWCAIDFFDSSSNPIYYAENLYINGVLIKELVIPDSVTSIGDYAFFDCDSLTSVTIGNSVTSIGDYAFYWCDSLTERRYPGTPEQWEKISIGSSNFNLTENIIYECNSERPYYGVGSCGSNLTWKLYGNGELVISGTGDMTNWSSYSSVPWDSCRSKIKSVTIGNGIKSIGDYAFYRCGLTRVTIGNSVTSIGSYAFAYCTSLTSTTIPDSVTSIGSYAFRDCDSLTSVTIPDSVTSIGSCAFYDCYMLTETRYPGTPEQWKEISIGSNNEALTKNIIYECDSEKPYYSAGDCDKRLAWKLYANGELVISGTGHMTDWSSYSSVPWYSCRSAIKSVTIGNGVTSIGDSAFEYCSSLESITIPDSVTSIGDYAFCGCGLTSITIGNGVTSIGGYAFYSCNSLTSVTIGNSVTSIGYYAFRDCDSLTSVTIPDSVTSIVGYAFYGCSGLTSVTIGNGVKSIGDSAFEYCSSLESITIPDSVTSIGDNAFHNCDSLKIATIGKNVTQIGNYAFCNCTNTKIACYANSTAHRFAIDNDIEVELLQNEYKVSWIVEGNATYQICEVGEKLVAPANPSKNGYRFVGWTPSVPSTMPNYDLTFTAVFESSGPVNADILKKPTQTTISYGDAIILHVDASKIPQGGYVEWTASNNNFDFEVSADGTECKITPSKSGDITFTATVYDANGKIISEDTQEMTSKAGFWQKLIAFFKKIFGLTKTYENVFIGII